MTDLERKAVQRVFELLEIAQGDLRDATEILRQALAQPEQEPVAHLWECIGRWAAMIAHDGKDANLAPPDWLIDAVKAATAPPSIEDAVLAEREACAKVCEKQAKSPALSPLEKYRANFIAETIRARGKK